MHNSIAHRYLNSFCRINQLQIQHILSHPESLGKENRQFSYFLLDWFSPSETIELHTSGSTGVPKRIQLDKKVMVSSAITTAKFLKLDRNMKALLCLSPNHIAGKMMIIRALVIGLDIKIIPPNSSPLDSDDIYYDFVAMVPLQINNSISQLERIKKVIVGGGVISSSLRKQLETQKSEIYETYGMTETASHIALRQISPQKEMYFKTLEGIEINTDRRGCLKIKSDIFNEEIITNDIVALKDKNSFELLGRYDNIINSGGIKIQPEVVEKEIMNFIKQPFILLGLTDKKLGEKLVLLVETEQRVCLEVIKQKLQLQKYQYPKQVYCVKELYRTPNGKIDRLRNLQQIKTNNNE